MNLPETVELQTHGPDGSGRFRRALHFSDGHYSPICASIVIDSGWTHCFRSDV